MAGRACRAPAAEELAAAVARVAPRSAAAWPEREAVAGAGGLTVKVSQARARQLWMVVGMWERALAREDRPGRRRRTAAQLFTPAGLRTFWDLAQAGELRALRQERGREAALPPATLRIVRDCLRIMAALVLPQGTPIRLPSVPQPEPKSTVRPDSLATAYRRLADLAATGPLERNGLSLSHQDRTRLLAMVAIVLEAGPRSGELAALQVTDLAPGAEAVAVRRRQQKAPPNRADEIAALAEVRPSSVRAVLWGHRHQVSEATRQRILAAQADLEPLPDVEWYALREGSRVAVRRWLEVRAHLLATGPLTGGRPGLWVTLVPTKAGPPGITLRPQGLTQAFARGMTALNWVMAGQRGWEPMPVRMEQATSRAATTPASRAPGTTATR
ncbi:hypothetical protein ACQB60_31765 [Actinomycetota bacterium Odt1-20B]